MVTRTFNLLTYTVVISLSMTSLLHANKFAIIASRELQRGDYKELTILHSYYHLRYNFLQEVHCEEMIAYVSSSK